MGAHPGFQKEERKKSLNQKFEVMQSSEMSKKGREGIHKLTFEVIQLSGISKRGENH